MGSQVMKCMFWDEGCESLNSYSKMVFQISFADLYFDATVNIRILVIVLGRTKDDAASWCRYRTPLRVITVGFSLH